MEAPAAWLGEYPSEWAPECESIFGGWSETAVTTMFFGGKCQNDLITFSPVLLHINQKHQVTCQPVGDLVRHIKPSLQCPEWPSGVLWVRWLICIYPGIKVSYGLLLQKHLSHLSTYAQEISNLVLNWTLCTLDFIVPLVKGGVITMLLH